MLGEGLVDLHLLNLQAARVLARLLSRAGIVERFPRLLRASRISGDPQTELAPTVADPRADGYRATTSNKSALAS